MSPLSDQLNNQEPTIKSRQCEIVIAGGGIAGSLVAIHLARAGFQTVLFEKKSRPAARLASDFLSFESLPLLREIGIDPLALGGAEITGLRVQGPTQSVALRLPHRSFGLSHTVLCEEMLRAAALSGCDVRRGVAVGEILEGFDDASGSIVVSTSDGDVRASRLVVATGHSGIAVPESKPRSVAFKVHLRLKPSSYSKLKGHRDLFSFEGGFGSLTDIGNGFADFSFQMERSLVDRLGPTWEVLGAHIGRTNWSASHDLDGAQALISSFVVSDRRPESFLRRTPPPPGLFFVGGQMAVLPTLSGGEMATALITARHAVDSLVERGLSGELRLKFAPVASRQYQRAARLALRPRFESGMVISSIFKNPRLTDLSTRVLRAFPVLLTEHFGRLFGPLFLRNRGASVEKFRGLRLPLERACEITGDWHRETSLHLNSDVTHLSTDGSKGV